MTHKQQFCALLTELTGELQAQQLWQQTPPSPEKLASSQPFAIDTMEPQEWLQWVFIPRIQAMLDAGQPLPSGFEMAPYFEQAWAEQPECAGIVAVIVQIDKLVAA